MSASVAVQRKGEGGSRVIVSVKVVCVCVCVCECKYEGGSDCLGGECECEYKYECKFARVKVQGAGGCRGAKKADGDSEMLRVTSEGENVFPCGVNNPHP